MIANNQNTKCSVAKRECCVVNPLRWLLVSWLLLVVVVLCYSSVAGASEVIANNHGQVIRVGLYQDPPSLWMDEQGEVKGFFADLLNHVAEREGWQLEYVNGSWCELIQWLEEDTIDLLPAVYPELEDQYGLAMSQSPVLTDWGQVYSPRNAKIQTVLDLDGKRVAVENLCIFYDGETGIKSLAEQFNVAIDFVSFDVASKALEDLRHGRIDAIVLGRFYNNMPDLGDDIVKTPILLNPVTLYFGTTDGPNADLLPILDHHIRALKEERGSIYYQSWQRWYSRSLKPGLPSWVVEAGIVIVAIVSMLIGFSLFARYQVEKKTREISVKNERLRSLSMELTLAEEKERRRLAELLHDNLGQNLALAKIRLSTMADQHTNDSCHQAMGEIKGFLNGAIRSTRSLTAEMSPPALYDLNFLASLKWLADSILRTNGINSDVVGNGKDVVLPENTKVLLFRTVRELLVNIVKHAEADYVKIELSQSGKLLKLAIEDNGVGMPMGRLRERDRCERGFGLLSIRERITYLGGAFNVVTSNGEGTLIKLEIPLPTQGESS